MKKNVWLYGALVIAISVVMVISQFFDYKKISDMGYEIRTIALHPCESVEDRFCTNPDKVQFTIMFVEKIGE